MSPLSVRALQGVESLWNSLSSLVCSLDAFVAYFWDVFGKSTSAASMHDELFQLRQADMSIHDNTVRFHTLAASSGWNETALLSAFQRGLNPSIWQQMSIYEDTVGLESLLQKALHISQHLTSCHTGLLANLDPSGSVSHSLLLDLSIRFKIRTVWWASLIQFELTVLSLLSVCGNKDALNRSSPVCLSIQLWHW